MFYYAQGVTILVGIPSHKRPEMLRECLGSVAAQEGQLPSVVVFVADNDPLGQEGRKLVQDMVAGSYRFPLSATIVAEPGISAVRNAILAEGKRSGADFIAMIDDDETASPEWLHHLLKVQKVTGADVVGGPVEYVFSSPPPPSIVNSRIFWSAPRPSGETSPLNAGGNFLVSAQALGKVAWPAFDSDFGLTGGEDSEWFIHLSRLGFRFAWAGEAWVHERVAPERATPPWMLRRAYRCANCGTRASLKHRDWIRTGFVLARSAAVLALAPFMAPLLALPSWRLWLQVKWWRAAGRFAALFGLYYQEYVERHDGHAKAR